MPRVTHVKRAQVRYHTVPTLDDNGEQVVTPRTKKDGTPKTDKRGRAITMRVTHEDRTRPPQPNHVCGKCQKEILPGEPYKWIAPKSGPYGGHKMYRCGTCPVWQVWEYSQSMSARLAQISHDFSSALDSCTTEDDVTGALGETATQVRELADEKRESAQNIEDGFQHATSQSDELNDTADQLESWADEIEQATVPDFPEPDDDDCDECDGSGELDNEDYDTDATEGPASEEMVECGACNGVGTVERDEPTEEQISEWLDQCRDELTVVDESPV